MKIPLCIPNIDKGELSAVKKVLSSGWLAHGSSNTKFEEEFAYYIGVKYAVTLNSCTSALYLAILAEGITGEIILPSFTFVASANAIVTAGAKPVFADIEYDSFNIDPQDIESKITQDTQAIMPVHFGGQSCQMDKILEIARKYELKVIEDSAETIGGKYKNKKTGSFGIGCFSFFPTKNLTTGEGGMLTTNSERLKDTVKAYANHGIFKTTGERSFLMRPWRREANLAGYNFRMSNILAAIGVEQLKKIDRMNQLRREHAEYLNKNLLKFEEIEIPQESESCYHVYQMYAIKLKNINRDKFITYLHKDGVMASVHFDPPVHLQAYYKRCFGYKKRDLPITEVASSSVVTLPMYPQLKKRELDKIILSVERAIGEAKGRRR